LLKVASEVTVGLKVVPEGVQLATPVEVSAQVISQEKSSELGPKPSDLALVDVLAGAVKRY
jgi:hypothetical protein